MKEFFDVLRKHFGPLKQSQVDGFNTLHAATSGLDVRHRAYLMATAWHETAFTMQPIHERGPRTYFNKYDVGTKIGKVLGNTEPGDGYRFRGRGYVQLTGRRNYDKAGKATATDLLSNPDAALNPDLAARILIKGCMEGWFTGKKLSDYPDYPNMRRVVNGTDKADTIARYAVQIEEALRAAQVAPKAPDPAPEPVPPPAAPEPVKKNPTVAQAIVALIVALVGVGAVTLDQIKQALGF
jgi:hypothetical protein